MTSTPKQVGPYELKREIGRGGMGVVYLARDTRLDRDVAIKTLPEEWAADPDRLARFEREARTLAQLNHPNVAGIYGIEEQDGRRFLILEYVEGETVGDQLDRGRIPVDDALEIAIKIAAGVEAAHTAGVIHRDLKPDNIKLTPDGEVKVLDFGLARTEESSTATGTSPDSPTLTSPVHRSPTLPGAILGTAAYMSPEQARGRRVDKRTDIWSFGVVLYEMLTGASPFVGETVSDSIGAILHKQIDLVSLPAGVPPAVGRVLRRCLQRDRDDRFRDIGDVAIELREATGDDVPIADVGAGGRRLVLAIAAVAVLALGLGWIASAVLTPGRAPGSASSQVIVAQIVAPPSAVTAFHYGFALSPDGTTLAFTATDAAGRRRIWTRPLDVLEAQPVQGTEEGVYPMWSPDGTELAFFVEDELRRVPATGGRAVVICDAAGGFPWGSWGSGDVILFTTSVRSGARISAVSAGGGSPIVLDDLGPAVRPVWLADGRRFLFQRPVEGEQWELRVASVDGGESVLVEKVPRWTGFSYSNGYVLQNRNDALTVQRFDEAAGRLTGSPVAVAGEAGTPRMWFAVSATPGRLVGLVRYSSEEAGDAGDPPSRFEWVDREGEPVGFFGPPGRYWTMRLSPDGRRVATNQEAALWVLGSSGRQIRVSSAMNYPPVWSPDGDEIITLSPDLGSVRRRAQPGSTPSVLENAEGTVSDLSADGRWLLSTIERDSHDILVYDMRERTTTRWLATEFDEHQARFSPGGRWVAYVSNAGGRNDVYVLPFDRSRSPIVVSLAGGSHPVWRGDGQELFYLSADGAIMATDVNTTEGSIELGRPEELFRRPLNTITIDDFSPYDVAADGRRFLLNVPDRPLPLLFLQGWEELVR